MSYPDGIYPDDELMVISTTDKIADAIMEMPHHWYIVEHEGITKVVNTLDVIAAVGLPYVGPYWTREEAQRVLDRWL